jgi:tellurite resistance protein
MGEALNMTSIAQNATGDATGLTDAQTKTWLRALLALAWADGNFDAAEQAAVASVMPMDLTMDLALDLDVLGETLGGALSEDFLRTAVMVAIADGTYSQSEDDLLAEFCRVLKLDVEVLASLRLTLGGAVVPQGIDPLKKVRVWLDGMDVKDPRVARFLCKLIPSQCPFERDVVLFGKKVVHIPPMCKINPLYEQLVGLRFRSLSYLADDCGEDVTPYL